MTQSLVQDVDPRTVQLVTGISKSLGKLLISRKDTKAVETSIGWVPDRERVAYGQDPTTGALIPFRNQDMWDHLLNKRCLGTYLLDSANMVKFFALDIDMSKDPQTAWYVIHDQPVYDGMVEATTNAEMTEGELRYNTSVLDLETHHGPLEQALHDPSDPAYRWARTILYETMMVFTDKIRSQLGLPVLPVITGGGAHLIVPFGQLVPAREAREMAQQVMEDSQWRAVQAKTFWEPPIPYAPVSIEIFPKQDAVQPGGFGNLIRLPMGWHSAAKMRTYFLKTEQAGTDPAWILPKRSSTDILNEAMSFFGMEA